jgi:hypothetical protein
MKNTPVVHDDWDSIRLASVKMKELADGLNTARTSNEHLQKIIEIQKRLTGEFLVWIFLNSFQDTFFSFSF